MSDTKQGDAHFTVNMIDPQGQALREIADKRMTRDDVALTYAFMLRQHETDRAAEVNQAIIDRWTLSALSYIKRKAWRRLAAGPGAR